MFDFATLFWLLLGLMAMITVCLLLVGYEMARRDVVRTREPAKAAKECAYFFGFLSKRTLDKPIPSECFGCVLALSCVKATESTKEKVRKRKVQVAKLRH